MKLFHFFFTIQISNYRKRIDLSAVVFFCLYWVGRPKSLAEGAGRKWSFLVHSTLHVSTHVGPCSNKSQNPRAARIQSQHILYSRKEDHHHQDSPAFQYGLGCHQQLPWVPSGSGKRISGAISTTFSSRGSNRQAVGERKRI